MGRIGRGRPRLCGLSFSDGDDEESRGGNMDLAQPCVGHPTLLHSEEEDDSVRYIGDHGAEEERKHTEHDLCLLHLLCSANCPISILATIYAGFVEESVKKHERVCNRQCN